MQRTARTLKATLEGGVDRALATGGLWAVVAIGFISVAREGDRDDPAAVVDGAVLRRCAGRARSAPAGPRRSGAARLAARPRDAATQPARLLHRDGRLPGHRRRRACWPTAILDLQEAGALPGPVHRRARRSTPSPAPSPSAWPASPSAGPSTSAAAIPPGGPLAAVLQATVGFMPRMSWLQVIAWALYVAIVGDICSCAAVLGTRRLACAASRSARTCPASRPRSPVSRASAAPSPSFHSKEKHDPPPSLPASSSPSSRPPCPVRLRRQERRRLRRRARRIVDRLRLRCLGAPRPSGTLAFDVNNDGDEVIEFYLLADDGLRIVGEVENIAPGASRTLTVVAQPGDYYTRLQAGDDRRRRRPCRLRGVGRCRRASTGRTPSRSSRPSTCTPPSSRTRSRSSCPLSPSSSPRTSPGTTSRGAPRSPQVRAYYERIEPVAEALGDLDPRIDYREVDAVADGLDWTGFHRIEKDLWVPAADALNADGETPAWQDWAPSTAAGARSVRRPAHRRCPGAVRLRALRRLPGGARRAGRRGHLQRCDRAPRRGRDGQDHRRRGLVVGHGPLGLRRQCRGVEDGVLAGARLRGGEGRRGRRARRARSTAGTPPSRPPWRARLARRADSSSTPSSPTTTSES